MPNNPFLISTKGKGKFKTTHSEGKKWLTQCLDENFFSGFKYKFVNPFKFVKHWKMWLYNGKCSDIYVIEDIIKADQ